MGRGRIISGDNPYQVEMLENTGRVQARITALQKNLTQLQGDITAVSVKNAQLLAEADAYRAIFADALQLLHAEYQKCLDVVKAPTEPPPLPGEIGGLPPKMRAFTINDGELHGISAAINTANSEATTDGEIVIFRTAVSVIIDKEVLESVIISRHFGETVEPVRQQFFGTIFSEQPPECNQVRIEQLSLDVERALSAYRKSADGLILSKIKESNMRGRYDSLQASLEEAESIVNQKSGQVVELWCADYSLTQRHGDVVGLIELPSSDVRPISIYPNHQGRSPGSSAWQAERDGQAQPNGNMTAAGWFINTALNACMAKWRPRYRVGTVTEVFPKQWGVLPRARVTLDPVTVDGFDVNQADEVTGAVFYMNTYKVRYIYYLSYDAELNQYVLKYQEHRRKELNVLMVGDRVIIDFGGKTGSPVIIGFYEEPTVNAVAARYPLLDVYLDNIYESQFYVKPFCFGYWPQVIVRSDRQNSPFTEMGRFNIAHTSSPVGDGMTQLFVEDGGYQFGWIGPSAEMSSYSVSNYTMAQFFFNLTTYKAKCLTDYGLNQRFHLIAGGCVNSTVPGMVLSNADPELMLERMRPVTADGRLVLCDFDARYVGSDADNLPDALYSLPNIYLEAFAEYLLVNREIDDLYNGEFLHFSCLATDDPDWSRKQPGPLPRVSSEMGPLTLFSVGAGVAVQAGVDPLLSYSIANNPNGGSERPEPFTSLCLGENPAAAPGLEIIGTAYSQPEEPALAMHGSGLAATLTNYGLAAAGLCTIPGVATLFRIIGAAVLPERSAVADGEVAMFTAVGAAALDGSPPLNSASAAISSSTPGRTITGLAIAEPEQQEPVTQYLFSSAVNLAVIEPFTRYRLITRTPGITPPPVQQKIFTKMVNPTSILRAALAAGNGAVVAGIETIGQAYLQPPTVAEAVAAWNLETTYPPENDGKFRLAPFIITRIHFHT